MPYDEKLDARIREFVSGWEGVSSRKMFGGVCHLLHGNMVAGVWKEFLTSRGSCRTFAPSTSPAAR